MGVPEKETDLTSAALMFNWVEYCVFCTMLLLSLLIGVYYGWFKKQDTVAEYMLGGKKMGVFPVSMSMIFSHISGITILGVPTEVYAYGTQFFAMMTCWLSVIIVNNCLILPVLYPLQLSSIYEYLELRFSQGTRTLASLIFALSLLIYIPVVMFVPALAFNQVTGLSIPWVALAISMVCIFYTSFGGLKAVVWTDALQGVFTLGSMFFIVFLGFSKYNSIWEVFMINEKGNRMELFNMNPSPFVRVSFWTYSVGSLFGWISSTILHPGAMQRYYALPTIKHAGAVTKWTCVGYFVINILAILVGLLMYATYHDCDPVATKVVQKNGQVLPVYVMEVARDYPGLTGLFISGILSAALSTMSAGLNTVAGTLYEDLVVYVLKGEKLPETQQNFITKVIVLLLGLLCASLVLVVEKLGEVYQVGIGIQGVTGGALIGVFILGIFFPRANAKGAIAGVLGCILVMSVIVFGAQYYTMKGLLKFPGKVTSVAGCPANLTANLGFNASAAVQTFVGVGTPVVADESVALIFQMSFLFYTILGVLLVIAFGMAVSLTTEPVDSKCQDLKLLSPLVHRFIPQKVQQFPPSFEEYKMVGTEPSVQDLKESVNTST